MLFAVLGFGSIVLTYAMFQSRNSMLGFPCLIFWAIMSGYCYQESTATWDLYYLTFFGSIFMGVFCAFAAYGLRTKKEELTEGDEFIDEGKDDIVFIDEYASPSKAKDYYDEYGNVRAKYNRKNPEEEVVGDRARGVRERAAARRRRFDH